MIAAQQLLLRLGGKSTRPIGRAAPETIDGSKTSYRAMATDASHSNCADAGSHVWASQLLTRKPVKIATVTLGIEGET